MNEERHGFFDEEMQMLENFVGKEVSVIYFSRGGKQLEGMKGILTSVNSYDSVTVNNNIYYFLGSENTILCIGYGENQQLYFNKSIPQQVFLQSYPSYFKEDMLLMSEQQQYLGYSVKGEEMLKGR